MSDLLYATGVSIDFTSNGAAALLGIVEQAGKANVALKNLIVTTKELDQTFVNVGKSAATAAEAVGGYAEATAASAAASRAATASVNAQAAAYRNVQAAAVDARIESRALSGGAGLTAIPGGIGRQAEAIGLGQAAYALPGGGGGRGTTGRAYRMGGGGGYGGGGSFGGGGGGGHTPSYMSPLGGVPHALIRGAEIGALAGAGLAVDSIYEAGKLQRQLTLIQTATGANTRQMESIKQSAYDLSAATAQSVVQSAQVIGVMASSGINNANQLTPKFIDTVGKFADMQYLKSGGKVSFDEATKQAIQLAHLYHAYKPSEISPVLEQVNKLSFMMPDNLNRYLTQSSYYAPLFQRFGVPQEETLTLGAFLDRMGMGRGKGGTSLQNFLTGMTKPAELTGHRGAGRVQALEALGIYNHGTPNAGVFHADAKGDSVIDIFKALRVINEKMQRDLEGLHGNDRARKEREDIGLYQKAFGIQGARFGYLGDTKGLEQLFAMTNQLTKMPSISRAQGSFMQNLEGRSQQATSNFQSLMTEIGWQTLPAVTKGFKDLADALHGAQVWLHQNRSLELKVQHDVFAAIKGTEDFLVVHKGDWTNLRHDLGQAYDAAKILAPQLGNLASGFSMIMQGIQPLIGLASTIGGGLSGVGNWINSDPANWIDPRNWSKDFAAMNTRSMQTYGSMSHGGGGGFGPPQVHVHGPVNLHGLKNPADFARALHARTAPMIQHTAGTSGHIVSHAQLPSVLTVPH